MLTKDQVLNVQTVKHWQLMKNWIQKYENLILVKEVVRNHVFNWINVLHENIF